MHRFCRKHPAALSKLPFLQKRLVAGSEKLYACISEGGFDAAVCTGTLPALMLTKVLQRHSMELRTAFVSADYTCIPGLELSGLEDYFIPDEALEREFVQQGVPAERISVSGIPLRREFCRRTDKSDAKRLLGINFRHRHLLIMGDGLGLSLPRTLCRMAKLTSPDTEISVICGNSRRMEKILKRRFRKSSVIHIVGHTRQMSLYLDSADLYLTRPYGTMVAEAALKRCPMAFWGAASGSEARNMRFFTDRGAAIAASGSKALAKESLRALHSAETLSSMEKAMPQYGQHYGSALIFQKLNGGISPC